MQQYHRRTLAQVATALRNAENARRALEHDEASNMDDVFPLFGVLAYGLFAFYLLFALLKGNMKFGVRFFCIPIHPLRVNGTLMNSMLFNVFLLQLCSFSLIQFCWRAFRSYARFTAADTIFGQQARGLAALTDGCARDGGGRGRPVHRAARAGWLTRACACHRR